MSRIKLVLIESAMRSGTTLLQHIINTNSQYCGYCEYRCDYVCNSEKQTQANVLAIIKEEKPDAKFLVDKLLFQECNEKAYDLKAKRIIMIRNPYDSIVSNLKRLYVKHPICFVSKEHTFKYYLLRYRYLNSISLIKKDLIVISYENLVYKPNETLLRLSSFLNKAQFEKRYKIHSFTGKWGYGGDGSKKIMLGEISLDDINSRFYLSELGQKMCIDIEEMAFEGMTQELIFYYQSLREREML